MGFNREHIVVLQTRGEEMRENIQAFKNDLAKIPDILYVASSNSLPNRISSSTDANWPGKPENTRIPIYTCAADYDFLSVFDLKLAAGRDFSRDFPSDAQGAFLINETARKAFGWQDPIGRPLNRLGRDESAGRLRQSGGQPAV
jgi:putative ABC transport system permease protein